MTRKSILISSVGLGVFALSLFIWSMIAKHTFPEQPPSKDIAEIGLSPSAQKWAKRLRTSATGADEEQEKNGWAEA